MSNERLRILFLTIIIILVPSMAFYYRFEKPITSEKIEKIYLDGFSDWPSDEEFCNKGIEEVENFIQTVFDNQITYRLIECNRWNNSKMGFDLEMSVYGSESFYKDLNDRLIETNYNIFRTANQDGNFATDTTGDFYFITFYGKYGSNIITIELTRKSD